jgi:hypothetical protein
MAPLAMYGCAAVPGGVVFALSLVLERVEHGSELRSSGRSLVCSGRLDGFRHMCRLVPRVASIASIRRQGRRQYQNSAPPRLNRAIWHLGLYSDAFRDTGEGSFHCFHTAFRRRWHREHADGIVKKRHATWRGPAF